MSFPFKFIFKRYSILIGYIFFVLAIGDFHPLARFNMYDHFPNWAYYFYVGDNKGETIPLNTIFNEVNAGQLAHMFNGYFDENNFYYGYGKESKDHRNKGGNYLISQLNPNLRKDNVINYDSLFLFQVFLHIKDDEILRDSFVLIKENVNKILEQ